jgi:L-lactate dehydrogenase (cytochrome)
MAQGTHYNPIAFLYAAVAAGEDGVRHAIHLLREEIDLDMALVGVTSAAEMAPRRLAPARGSAFLPSPGT